jgi:hypothetical protein
VCCGEGGCLRGAAVVDSKSAGPPRGLASAAHRAWLGALAEKGRAPSDARTQRNPRSPLPGSPDSKPYPYPSSPPPQKKPPPGRYLYCNLPGLEFTQGLPTRLYMLALGGSSDMHTPNTAEGGLYLDGQRRQGVKLLPGAMLTADIT